MNSRRLKNRWFLIPSLALALSLALPGHAAEVELREFTAGYDLYKAGMHVGTAELSLEPAGQLWRWRLLTQARGIYAVFVNKKPFSETLFSREQGKILLQSIDIKDQGKEKRSESARFDWQAGQLNTQRKGKERQFPLTGEVYDYQSIHLLTAAMQLGGEDERTVDFYRKGKLTQATLTYTGTETITLGDREIETRVYRHVNRKSKTVLRYFYEAGQELVPVMIENRRGDDKPAIFRLREVDWRL